ncbi:MAG: hypothetical protein II994_02520 [Lachnospiraceae bacterium]|nr:hypothetical protein [Lachnospiraceae bacterium]
MLKLLNNQKLVVGYDLNDDYSQISYWVSDSDNVETLSMVAGAEDFNIPTVLCKREGVNQWFCGKEAVRYHEENNGILVKELVTLAVDGEPILIEGNAVDPVSLLTLFLKRSLGLLAQVSAPDKITAIIFTCKDMDARTLEVLKRAVADLHLKTDKVFFQSHTESFYHFMLQQEQELWKGRVVLLRCATEVVEAYVLECNHRTTPVVVYIEEKSYPFTTIPERMDSELLSIAEDVCSGNWVSAVYLIGEQFGEDWLDESLRFLCRGRRVFQGSNLFSKGACYGMVERIHPGEAGKNHVFLGREKLKVNVGMKIFSQGEENYLALLDAGVNWFESEHTFEFYLQDGNRIELIITSLTGKENKLVEIELPDLPGQLSRLRANVKFKNENCMLVSIEDLGLGAFREATHHIWKEEIEL